MLMRYVWWQLVNKDALPEGSSSNLQRRNSDFGFSKDDEKLLQMLCAHCAIFLQQLDTNAD